MEKKEVEAKFLELVAQYCDQKPDELTPDLLFQEDLGFSSFDFMSFLGELEDAFDIEAEEEDLLNIRTIGEALNYLQASL